MYKKMDKRFRAEIIREHLRYRFYYYAGKNRACLENLLLLSNEDAKAIVRTEADKASKGMEFFYQLGMNMDAMTGGAF